MTLQTLKKLPKVCKSAREEKAKGEHIEGEGDLEKQCSNNIRRKGEHIEGEWVTLMRIFQALTFGASKMVSIQICSICLGFWKKTFKARHTRQR